MSATRNSQYLESKVLTAPPHRLHLMLVEGAIRFGRQAEESLRRGDQIAAAPALLRMLDIVGELLAGVRGTRSPLNDKLGDFYWFLFCRVSLVKINGEAEKLNELLALLEFDRETWQMACDKLSAEVAPVPPPRAKQPHAPCVAMPGLSLEA